MKIGFSGRAKRDAKRLSLEIQRRIRLKLEWYVIQEEPLIFADKLTDSRLGTYRYRIGEYRVIFRVIGNTLFITRIGHRKEIYR
jgi:mRNA interferase RelE/StbE